MIHFINNLAHCRRLHQLTQKELATKVGVRRNTISNYENGVSNPDIDVLSKLIEVFGVSSDDFLFRDLSGLNEVPMLKNMWTSPEEPEQLRNNVSYLLQEVSTLINNDRRNYELINQQKNDIFQLQQRVIQLEEKKSLPEKSPHINKGRQNH